MASCPILSYSALVGVTLQLLACLAREQLLAAYSRKSPTRFSCESLFFLHTLEHFFTLSHSLPLQESHLNTGLLIAEIQTNLTCQLWTVHPCTVHGSHKFHFSPTFSLKMGPKHYSHILKLFYYSIFNLSKKKLNLNRPYVSIIMKNIEIWYE